MMNPQSGSIIIDDPRPDIFDNGHKKSEKSVDLNDFNRKELARCVAVVSQSAYVTFPYTAYDAVKMGRYARYEKSRKAENDKIYDALNKAGALEFAERSVNELSGGELRRVLIARALAQEPSVLLLDEPTLHLDVNHQFDLMDLITHLRDESNMIVIIVTHDMMFAARYCDEIILMEKGTIVDAGDTRDVLTSENIKRIFMIDAIVEYDERVKGLNVVMIGKESSETYAKP